MLDVCLSVPRMKDKTKCGSHSNSGNHFQPSQLEGKQRRGSNSADSKELKGKNVTIISFSYDFWVCPKLFLTVFSSYRIKSVPSPLPPPPQEKPSDLTTLRQILNKSTLRRSNRKSLWKLVAYSKCKMN